ncbi:hypothetical protein [Parasitella parasitica]|uniref:PiggyBac transposable element-derived protein domain-containing protein n=1 Tax=Parasitella parasitica TaxID=35722 RepID=A0A0B7N853_9FUNG|nr:hypothetical protein [Parasitella parasitica]
MIRALKDVGLFSIMQVKKKRYWPRGMPMEDIIRSLGEEVGDVKVVKSRIDSVFIASLRDKNPRCVIANAESTAAGSTVSRWIDGQTHTFTRPLVFEEYEVNKGAVDTANTRRDNLPSFHYVMKSYD